MNVLSLGSHATPSKSFENISGVVLMKASLEQRKTHKFIKTFPSFKIET